MRHLQPSFLPLSSQHKLSLFFYLLPTWRDSEKQEKFGRRVLREQDHDAWYGHSYFGFINHNGGSEPFSATSCHHSCLSQWTQKAQCFQQDSLFFLEFGVSHPPKLHLSLFRQGTTTCPPLHHSCCICWFWPAQFFWSSRQGLFLSPTPTPHWICAKFCFFFLTFSFSILMLVLCYVILSCSLVKGVILVIRETFDLV